MKKLYGLRKRWLTNTVGVICILGLVCVFVVIIIFIGMVYIRNNVFYINPFLNILGYSFYDITYKDESGECKELRIFYKGELKIENSPYVLYKTNRNLNFLDNDQKTK